MTYHVFLVRSLIIEETERQQLQKALIFSFLDARELL